MFDHRGEPRPACPVPSISHDLMYSPHHHSSGKQILSARSSTMPIQSMIRMSIQSVAGTVNMLEQIQLFPERHMQTTAALHSMCIASFAVGQIKRTRVENHLALATRLPTPSPWQKHAEYHVSDRSAVAA